MTNRSLAMPLYHQVASVLRQRIRESTYAIGTQLLPEDDLAAEFGVSRSTVRQAVGMLVDEGLIARLQGRGTFVEAPDKHLMVQRLRGPLSDLVRQSRESMSRDIEVAHDERFPEYVAAALRMTSPEGTVIRQTRVIDAKPFAYSVSYLPNPLGNVLSVELLQNTALLTIMMNQGVHIQGATQSIRAELADTQVCETMNIELGSAVLYLERLVRDVSQSPVELTRCWYRGDRYEYTVNLEAGMGDDPFSHFD